MTLLTGRQIREARALLGLNRSKFAHLVRTVSTATIVRAESVDGQPQITASQAEAITRALDRVGIVIGRVSVMLRGDVGEPPPPIDAD